MARIIEWREMEARWAGIPDRGTMEDVHCEGTRAIVYAGHGTTDAAGQWHAAQVNAAGRLLVYSHYANTGAPAEYVPFSWHCVVEFDLVGK